MNVIKPRGLGILTKVYQDRPAIYLSLGVLGYFDFATPGAFLPDTAMWPFVQGALPENTLLDLAMPKVCGEVLVYGKAMAQQGIPVLAMPVEIAIGAIRKRANVFGDRYWKLGVAGLHPTEPKPFIEMPVDYAHAFGGEGYARNPTGKGFDAERRTRAGEAVGLPNVEAPERPVVTPGDRPEPYGFGALDIAWADRTGKAGTFDDAWFKTRSPSAPLNQDPTLYNAAPPDQWRRDGWFALDEPFALAGFHAEHPIDRGRLPGLRARAFIQQKQPDGAKALLEIGLHLETIFLFATARQGVVLYRGRVPVADIDACDVTDVMLAYERMTDEPRPHAHYIEVFKLRTDPETKGLHAMNELQLAPALPPELAAEREAERADFAAGQMEKRQRRLDRAYDATLAAGGLRLKPGLPRPMVAAPPAMPIITPQDIARGEADLAGYVAAGQRLLSAARLELAEARDKGLAMLSEARAKRVVQNAAPPAAVPPSSDAALKHLEHMHARLSAVKGADLSAPLAKLESTMAVHRAGIGQEVAGLRAAVQDKVAEIVAPVARADSTAKATLLQTLDGVRRHLLDAPQQDSDQMKAALQKIENAMRPPPPAALASETTVAPPAVTPTAVTAQGEAASRAALMRSIEAAPPAARREMQAKAAIFDAAVAKAAAKRAAIPAVPAMPSISSRFERLPAEEMPAPPAPADETPDARKARFDAVLEDGKRKARLHSPIAIAPQEPLDAETAGRLRRDAIEAMAEGRPLSGHDFAGADLSGLSFRTLDLTGAMFEKADLTGADFSGANLVGGVFTEAVLAGARFDRAKLQGTNFCAVSAPGASFVAVDLTKAKLLTANFEEADFTGAKFDGTMIVHAQFKGAVLQRTQWEKCAFTLSDLAGVDMSGAQMRMCAFMKCDLTGARFRGATLFRVGLAACPADGSDFSEARLTRMIASGGSSFVDGTFRRALGNRSNWFKVDLTRADFTRAELDRSFIGETRAVEASFYRASLREAFLTGSDFTDADFSEANLFRANLRRAVLDRAELRHASLYGVVSDGASWQFADLTEANLSLTVFTRG
jgi:uncharacterized protein YjbI with pentapeptide repeats